MRNYTPRGLQKNSFANAKGSNKAQQYIGRAGLGVYKNPDRAYQAVAAIENIIRSHFGGPKRARKKRRRDPEFDVLKNYAFLKKKYKFF